MSPVGRIDATRQRVRKIESVECIKVIALEGSGSPDAPIREVSYYFMRGDDGSSFFLLRRYDRAAACGAQWEGEESSSP